VHALLGQLFGSAQFLLVLHLFSQETADVRVARLDHGVKLVRVPLAAVTALQPGHDNLKQDEYVEKLHTF
jgi:hypothetical protein